jgi:hypothetical protein
MGCLAFLSVAISCQKGIIIFNCSFENIFSFGFLSFWPAITFSGCLFSQIS